jgi:hypothetical protein
MSMLRKRNRLSVLGLVGVLTLALAGCETDQTTTVGDSVRSSGFLSDYSMLRRGDEGQAISVYWNDQADFSSYTRMLIEPVTIWTNPDAELNEVPAEERGAQSGVLLAAGIDQRAGTKALGGNTLDSWGDVREAFDSWAVQFRDNLRKRRN